MFPTQCRSPGLAGIRWRARIWIVSRPVRSESGTPRSAGLSLLPNNTANTAVSGLSGICLQSIIRRYAGNERSGRTRDIYVPLVNLREHKGINAFLPLFDEETSSFLRRNADADGGTYADRVVSCLLSRLLAEEFARVGGFSGSIAYEDFFILKSLGRQAADIIMKADVSIMRSALRTAAPLPSPECSGDAMDAGRTWLRTEKGDTFQKLCVYIKEAAVSARASLGIPSCPLGNLCKDLEDGGAKSASDVIWSILRLVEQGAANFKVAVSDGRIFTCLSPGEQSFRCMGFIDDDLVQCLHILSDHLSLERPDADKDAWMYEFARQYLQEKRTLDFTLTEDIFYTVFSEIIDDSTYENDFSAGNIARVSQYVMKEAGNAVSVKK